MLERIQGEITVRFASLVIKLQEVLDKDTFAEMMNAEETATTSARHSRLRRRLKHSTTIACTVATKTHNSARCPLRFRALSSVLA